MKIDNYYHTIHDDKWYIEGLGYYRVYYIDLPLMETRPHFHIIDPKTDRNIEICFKENRYANPLNHDRLTPEECKILNDYMNEIADGYESRRITDRPCTNWEASCDAIHVSHRKWIDCKTWPQPDYSTIKEPIPFSDTNVPFGDINRHSKIKFIFQNLPTIPNIGKIGIFEVEDSMMFQRPHVHILTVDGRNIEICIYDNRYANPFNKDRFTPTELDIFDKWVKYRGKSGLCEYWSSTYDERCTIPYSAKPCLDYSTIKEPLPFKLIDNVYGEEYIGECSGVGKIIMYQQDFSDGTWGVPCFYIRKFEDYIPISLITCTYLNEYSPKLIKKERAALDEWMNDTFETKFGKFTNWEFMTIMWNRFYGFMYQEIKPNTKKPNYNHLRLATKNRIVNFYKKIG